MADETIASGTAKSSIILEGEKDVIRQYTDIYTTDGSDMKAGQVVTQQGETAPDVDVHSGTEAIAGILLGYANENDIKASYSLGVTIADGKLVKVLRPTGGRVAIQVVLNRADSVSAEVKVGAPIYASQTDDGKVSSVDRTLATKLYLGRSMDNIGVSATADKLLRIWY